MQGLFPCLPVRWITTKYPDAVQKLRFERVMLETLTAEPADIGEGEKTEEKPHPLLMEFLEAEDLGQQIESLKRMKGKIGQKELDSIYVVLDMIPSQGEPRTFSWPV